MTKNLDFRPLLTGRRKVFDNSDITRVVGQLCADWDAVIVGDASGWGTRRPAGMAGTCVSRYWSDRIPFWGAESHSRIDEMEVLVGIRGLWLMRDAHWFEHLKIQRARRNPAGLVYVAVLSDSEAACGYGNEKPARTVTDRTRAELNMIPDLRRSHGVVARWHWLSRGCLQLHEAADDLSRRCRIFAESMSTTVRALVESNPHTMQIPRRPVLKQDDKWYEPPASFLALSDEDTTEEPSDSDEGSQT